MRRIALAERIDTTAQLTAQGYTAVQISKVLHCSPRSVYEYRRHAAKLPLRYDSASLPVKKREDYDPGPWLEDSPEGFFAFFNEFAPYEDGIRPHNQTVIRAMFDYGSPADSRKETDGEATGGTAGNPGHVEQDAAPEPSVGGAVGIAVQGSGGDSAPPVRAIRGDGKSGQEQQDGNEYGDHPEGHRDNQRQLGRWKDQIIENMPPRHAKSEVMLWFVIWRLILNRSTRIIFLSRAFDLMQQHMGLIAYQMEFNSKLLKAFGRLKPKEDEGAWRPSKGELDIAGKDREMKEHSLRARGSMQQVIGLACDWLIADDVVTMGNSDTVESRNKLDEWFFAEALSRVEPEGHAFVIGTRVHQDDLYGRLSSRRYSDEDLEEPAKLWEHIVFPALRDPRTGLPSLAGDAEALWPNRWTRKKLLEKLAADPRGSAGFNSTYQQDPLAAGDRLAEPEWIAACLDDRLIGQAKWPRQDVVRICALDPSPTRFAGLVIADILPSRETFDCAVLDLDRRRMNPTQMLDAFDRIQETYGPIDYWIVEQNAAQRFFLESSDAKAWDSRTPGRLMPHTTHATNKNQSEYGIGSLSGDFEFARISLPGGDVNARMKSKLLGDEAVNYSLQAGAKNGLTDLLMALWFIKFNFSELNRKRRSTTPGGGWKLPGWLEGARW